MKSIMMIFDDNTDINMVYNQLREQYPDAKITVNNNVSFTEQLEDEYLRALAHERKKNDTGIS